MFNALSRPFQILTVNAQVAVESPSMATRDRTSAHLQSLGPLQPLVPQRGTAQQRRAQGARGRVAALGETTGEPGVPVVLRRCVDRDGAKV